MVIEMRKMKSDNLVVVGVDEVVIVIVIFVVVDHQMINEGQWRHFVVVVVDDYGVEKDE